MTDTNEAGISVHAVRGAEWPDPPHVMVQIRAADLTDFTLNLSIAAAQNLGTQLLNASVIAIADRTLHDYCVQRLHFAPSDAATVVLAFRAMLERNAATTGGFGSGDIAPDTTTTGGNL